MLTHFHDSSDVLPICCHAGLLPFFPAILAPPCQVVLNLSMEKDGHRSNAWYLVFSHWHNIAGQMFIPPLMCKLEILTPLIWRQHHWYLETQPQNLPFWMSPYMFRIIKLSPTSTGGRGPRATPGDRSWCCRWCSGSVASRHSPSAHRGGCRCDASGPPRWSWPTTAWTARCNWPGGQKARGCSQG